MATAPTPVPHERHPRRLVALLFVVVVVLLATVIALLVRESTTTNVSVGVLGSGVAASESRPLPAFHGVDLAGSSTLTVRLGPKQSVDVHADDNLIDVVTTAVSGGTLVVDNVGSFTTKTPMHVDVTVPTLDSISLTGSGAIDVSGIDSRTFRVELRGSGVITGAGTTGQLDAALTGSGDCRLQALAARRVTARLSGSGRLTVSASRTLDATIAGTGVIAYAGNPGRVTKNVSGTGAIVQQ